jgi:hypothetical protein
VNVRRADPDKSRVVLVGTPFYRDPDLQDLPGVANNISDLAAVLTDPELGGLDPAHCAVAPPDADQAGIGGLLTEAADQAEDMLLFYYAGHGLLGPTLRRELHLGLAGSRIGRQVPFSSLKFSTVHDAWLDSPAKNKIVILDCCFSGRALLGQSMADDEVLGQLEVAGSYTLTAAPGNSLAIAPLGERNTAFTARLLKLLHEGTPQAGPILSMDDIYRHLRSELRAARLPEPQQIGTATASLLGLVRNRHHDAGVAAPAPVWGPPTLPEELIARLDSPLSQERVAAVEELARLLVNPSLGRVARALLADVAANDLPLIAGAARAALQGSASASVRWYYDEPPMADAEAEVGRDALGAESVSAPPALDWAPPAEVLEDPVVPEHRRFCSICDEAVGRGSNGQPGLPTGVCPGCGHSFSFEPTLKAGDSIGSYEIVGCLKRGAVDWIYLARRPTNAGRWVVLKHLTDFEAVAVDATIAAHRFLVDIDHPLIVKTYDLLAAIDTKTGPNVLYSVMEYVSGTSLKELRSWWGGDGRSKPLPIEQAIGYMIEILPALGYLHSRGLAYPDFKPDNVIQSGEQLKLIDLNGVIHMEDRNAAVYCTRGYFAPEVTDTGVSVRSDLYAVGRTLAALAADIKGFQTTHRDSLPSPAEVPLFAEHESFYRFLLRATNKDPDLRFESAAHMAQELTVVLRDVLQPG